MLASEHIGALANLLRDLGRYSNEDTMEVLARVDVGMVMALRHVLERAPKAITGLVAETVLEAAKSQPNEAGAQLIRWVNRHGFDVRSFREAARSLEYMAEGVLRSDDLNMSVGAALLLLEEKGALGHRSLGDVARFLRAVYHRARLHEHDLHDLPESSRQALRRLPSTPQLAGDTVTVGDESLNRLAVAQLAKELLTHDPEWAKRALEGGGDGSLKPREGANGMSIPRRRPLSSGRNLAPASEPGAPAYSVRNLAPVLEPGD